MGNQKFLFLILSIVSPVLVFGFTFSVTPTNETCAGNGTLTFAVSNPAPGGIIEYRIYKLPNTSIPYATTTANTAGGLAAGTYQVTAVETVAGTTTMQQQTATIENAVVPLVYTVQSLNQACASVSNIFVNVTSGTAVSYEVFEGPITFPSQASNIFNNLPVGTYKIRVFDACGTGVVSTFTVTLNAAGLSVSQPTFGNVTPPSCTSTVAQQVITPATGTVIAYPLTLQYTVHPPDASAPIIFTQVIGSGDPLSQAISQALPAYINQDYTYDLVITDACGTVTPNSFLNSQAITLQPTVYSLACNDNYFDLKTTNFVPPYSLNFSVFPAGFNPTAFNSGYPGPYTTDTVAFGSESMTVPLGNYTVSITDSCGKTKTISFEILDIPPVPDPYAVNDGCLSNTGTITITIPHYRIATAIVTSAPPGYSQPLPHDVSSAIDAGVLTLSSLPLGDYVIALTDLCGSVITPVSVNIPAYINQPLAYDIRPGCELQKSSIKISSGNNSKLTAITIDTAPAGFAFPLPYNGISNIAASGDFYLNNIPPGNYAVTVTDECGFTNSATIAVAGYSIASSAFSLQTNCGTFDIDLNFVSNGNAGESYWLQKALTTPANGWGNPVTNAAYNENSVPDANNSYPLTNNTTNFNLAFNGTFRIVRSFYSYNNGSEINNGAVTSPDKNCIEILQPTLFFNESLEIIDASRMACTNSGNLDVILDVNGPSPLHFRITEKDGVAFAFDNGTSNIFYNLEAAVYTFEVEDACGNIVPRQFDVSALSSLITLTKPHDLLNCVTVETGNETFDLATQNATILGTQSPADYTLKYYNTITDAQSDINPISNLSAFNPANNPQTIYAGVRFNQLPDCYEITTFDLYTGITPELNVNTNYRQCDNGPVTIDVLGNNLATTTFSWSNGSTDSTVTISQPGLTDLTVTATNVYGTESCTATKNIQIIISKPPTIDRIDTVDWTDEENSITILSATPDFYEYALDGNNFQSQNVFNYLRAGIYTVTIRDKFGCGSMTKEVWLLNYPKFFTPNGDGYNDRWFIPYAENEPDFKVYIFDRYGKLLTGFGSKDPGWDGIYNGREIFSDDYWFVVHRQDGRILKGHFALKR